MFRSFLSGAAIAAVALTAGAAQAQTRFTPPLDRPTPLAAPVAMALQPGAAAECVSEASITGMDLPSPPPSRTNLTVSDSADGVILRVVEGAGLYDITLLIAEDGTVTLGEGSRMSGADLLGPNFLDQAAQLMPEVRIHRRTLAQGDSIVDEEEVSQLIAGALGPLASENAQIDVTGGSVVAGESATSAGRRVIVFDSEITLSVPSEGVDVRLIGVDAYDAETALRVYSNYTMNVAMPPAAGIPELVFNQTLNCELTPGS